MAAVVVVVVVVVARGTSGLVARTTTSSSSSSGRTRNAAAAAIAATYRRRLSNDNVIRESSSSSFSSSKRLLAAANKLPWEADATTKEADNASSSAATVTSAAVADSSRLGVVWRRGSGGGGGSVSVSSSTSRSDDDDATERTFVAADASSTSTSTSSASSSLFPFLGPTGLINSLDPDLRGLFSYRAQQDRASSSSCVGPGPFSTTSALYTSRHTSLPEDSFGTRLHRPSSSSSVGGSSSSSSSTARQLERRGDREQQRKDELEHAADSNNNNNNNVEIDLTEEEEELFELLRMVTTECGMGTTLRVAGGWVRDKILASEQFRREKSSLGGCFEVPNGLCDAPTNGVGGAGLGAAAADQSSDSPRRTSDKRKGKFNGNYGDTDNDKKDSSLLSVTVPVDIDIALDDRLGREFADELNSYLSAHGRATHSVGLVQKNPEKSKHLETATMRVNDFWIDFVNLRAEEYASDSRIPELMRIGTAEEDALRRDLTINSLFYNVNEGRVEDMTGRGLDDLRRGKVATPLPPLTTLLDDPLRVLRSVRFAARLGFGMEEGLRRAAADDRVRLALEQKVSRERVGGEVDLMLKSNDPVRAMRLLVNLGLIETVFPLPHGSVRGMARSTTGAYHEGLSLLGTAHDYLCGNKADTPSWCEARRALEAGAVNGVGEEGTRVLVEDERARKLLWYAAFLKPLRERTAATAAAATDVEGGGGEEVEKRKKKKPRRSNRSVVLRILVDEMKRPMQEAESVERLMRAADKFTALVRDGGDVSARLALLSSARVLTSPPSSGGEGGTSSSSADTTVCAMGNRVLDPDEEDDPVWSHCMEFRRDCADILRKIGPLWRAAFVLSLCEQVGASRSRGYDIEHVLGGGDVFHQAPEEAVDSIIQSYDLFAAAMMQLGLVGIWNQAPLLDGNEIKKTILPNIPRGPIFRDVMDAQTRWMTCHPGGSRERLAEHLRREFTEFQ